MIISKAKEVSGYTANTPCERTLKVLISPELQGVKNIAVGMTIIAPGGRTSSHVHLKEEEPWYIVEGQGLLIVDGHEMKVEKDTVIVVLPGEYHQITNTGQTEMKILWIYTPPGEEQKVILKQHL